MCEPRQVWTFPIYSGLAISEMSKMRIPRRRSWLTVSWIPWSPQSSLARKSSPDTKSRFSCTDTSLCEAGHTWVTTETGFAGSEMSQTWMPLKLPWMA